MVAFFREPSNREVVERLREYDLQMVSQGSGVEKQSDKLTGKSFLISGVFATYSRDELKEMIESHGGKNASGVSAKLDYLVAGDIYGAE